MSADAIRTKAAARLREIQRAKQNPRYRRAVAAFVHAGLLRTNDQTVRPRKGSIALGDVLFAGKVEPRFFELLPAAVLKKPGLFKSPIKPPDDLAEVIRCIRNNEPGPDFRGIPEAKYRSWVPRVGHRGKLPTVLRSYRFTHDDLDRMRRLREVLPVNSDTELIRLALKIAEGQ